MFKWTPYLSAMFLALLLAACESTVDPDKVQPPPPPPPPVVTTTVIQEDSFSDLTRNFYVWIPFRTGVQGDIKAIVDWTFAADTLWMYLAEGTCGREFADSGCPFGAGCQCDIVVASEAMTPKPRTLSADGRPPGVHTLLVWNRGPETESISWQIILKSLQSSTDLSGPHSLQEPVFVTPVRKDSP